MVFVKLQDASLLTENETVAVCIRKQIGQDKQAVKFSI